MSVIKSLKKKDFKELTVSGSTGSLVSKILSQVKKENKSPVTVLLPDESYCETILFDIKFFSPKTDVRIFSEYKQDIFKSDSLHMEAASSRINLLYELINSEFSGIILVPVTAASRFIIPIDVLENSAEIYGVGEDIEMDEIVKKLVKAGYTRTSLVEEPGDFAIRGGILDLFSPVYSDPVRIEFFGDTIDSIRLFSVNSQRKLKTVDEALVIPVSEVVIDTEKQDDILVKIRKKAASAGAPLDSVKGVIEKIKNEGCFQGIEYLLPLFYKNNSTIFDYLPKDSLVATAWLDKGKENLIAEHQIEKEKYFKGLESGTYTLHPDELFVNLEDPKKNYENFKIINFKDLPYKTDDSKSLFLKSEDNSWVKGELRSKIGSNYPLSPLSDWVNDKLKKDFYPIIVCSTTTQAQRLLSVLKPYGLSPVFEESINFDLLSKKVSDKELIVTIGRLSEGFTFEDENLAFITENEIFGVKSRRKKKVRKLASERIYSLNELAEDDVVVHVDHGLGKYKGLERIMLAGLTGEFAVVEYRDDDRLYIPVDRINILQKYVGADSKAALLDKLGGKEWTKAKEKAKKKAEKIAKELLAIYAKREVNKGYSFAPPDDLFKDFEASFPYDETPGQIKAINDVIKDMSSDKPMDRLICGDVGYGKTEVAVRAAFKAVSDGRQVAILVPTTVLAEQHYKTFIERFSGYPFKISVLNRFRTRKQQTQILKGMQTGEVDIVIGTHRLLQKDIEFNSLGLLVIDEEQRFGVKHKEKIKGLRSSVDILTLTATPIPRTLHFSLSGIRDISIISTPPEARQPIVSYISEFDETIIREAIINEVKRDGQVYFVHNNISTIDNICNLLEKQLPNLKIGKAHGRMPERELEDEMKKFIHRETDVLVCTTIVESGLDIAGANTMIVNRADRFGLSQLYQLRGRIGRGKEQAYAYLFVPEENRLTKDASKRLKVLMQYSDLGAGFQLAMGDLQIRGAGDILGASQSGHVSAIGYDMFVKLLENAVSEIRGEDPKESLEPEINLNVSAFIPEAYIPDIDQRMIIYRRLTRLKDIRELSGFKKELQDRYGKVPRECENLLLKIMLRILCIQCKVSQLDMNQASLILSFSKKHIKNEENLLILSLENENRKFIKDLRLKAEPAKGKATMSFAKKTLQEIKERVNGN